MFRHIVKRLHFHDGLAKFREKYTRFKTLEATANKISFAEALTSEAPTRRVKYQAPASKDLHMSSTCISDTGEQITEEIAHAQNMALSLASTAAAQQRSRGAKTIAKPAYLEKELLLESSTPGAEADVCAICNVSISGSWNAHCYLAQHRISAAIYTILMLYHRDRSAEEIFQDMLEAALLHPIGYFISKDLLGESVHLSDIITKFRSIIQYLKTQHVLTYSLNLKGIHTVFDQVERVGDLVLSPIIHDVIGSIFDLDSPKSVMPILAPSLSNSQTHYGSITDGFLCSNAHLEFVFDRLELTDLVEFEKDKLEGKAKADVMEAILGELELFLWACEAEPVVGDWSKREYIQAQHHSLITLADHTKNLLVSLIVLIFVKSCVEYSVPVIRRYEKRQGREGQTKPAKDKLFPSLLLVPHIVPSETSMTYRKAQFYVDQALYDLSGQRLQGAGASSFKKYKIQNLVD